jgi:predicted permease
MDGVAVLFTLGLALVVGILVGLVPVLNLRHMNLNQAFREESRSGTSGRATRTVRRLLVATQIAFAFMLLVGAGLLLASFERVLAVSPGFNPAHVLTARVALPASRYKGEAETRTFGARLLELVQGSGAVQQAGITSNIPFGGNFSDSVILAEGYQMKPGESVISPYRVIITPGYFETMGIPLREGRFFTPGDTSDSPQVVVVDERLARRFWGSSSPIGRRMYQPDSPEDLIKPGPKARFCTVVGVVGEIRMAGLVNSTDADDRVGAYYFPFAQHPQSAMTLAVRTAGEPSQAGGALRAAVRSIDPELPLFSVMSMEERMSESLTDRRTPMVLALAFAVVALFLAAVGIYGVLAFQVTQRTREIGIRMALGSDARGIAGLVLREGLALLAAGLGVGLVGAFAIRRAMETQLYGVTGMDPTVIAAVGGVLGLVAVIACLLPARRAAQIDPMTALAE